MFIRKATESFSRHMSTIIFILLLHALIACDKSPEEISRLNFKLAEAASQGDAKTIQTLLERGGNPNVDAHYDGEGNTALILAVRGGYTGAVKLLLEKGADVNAKNQNGFAAIVFAVRNEYPPIIRLLHDHGADLNVKSQGGFPLLIAAVKQYNENLVKALLDLGAEIDMRDSNGNTALIEAAISGQDAIVAALLMKGASVNEKNGSGDTALMCAKTKANERVVRMLEEAEATMLRKVETEENKNSKLQGQLGTGSIP